LRYAQVMSSFGPAGRLVHNERDQINALTTAAATVQRALLELGFSSSYGKLSALAVVSGRLLDGRSDLADTDAVFDPPRDRYKSQGERSAGIMRLKRELIAIFRSIAHLRTNYRLTQLLANFRAKEAMSQDKHASKFKISDTLLGSFVLSQEITGVTSTRGGMAIVLDITCLNIILF
jgi:hypothetical protein